MINKAEVKNSLSNIGLLKILCVLCFFFAFRSINAQNSFKIEIPAGFTKEKAIGKNVNLRAVDENGAAIVVVVIEIPPEYRSYSILDMLGDLDTYALEIEADGQEYLSNAKVVKYGKTVINEQVAFWYDLTANNPDLYQKTYQLKKGLKSYTMTLSCPSSMKGTYEAIWFRVKNSLEI